MPITRAAANRNASAATKAKPTSKGVSKSSRERQAKVTKKTGSWKAKKGKIDKNTTTHLNIGSKILLTDKFGGELYLCDGTKTSLKQLVDKSRNGIIGYIYPKPWDDDAYDMYGEFEHAQLDWEMTEMDTIGISPDSALSTAAFVKEKDISLPLFSNPGGSLSKEMSIISPKGKMIKGAFIISKSGVLLARTIGKQDQILDDLQKVICTLFEDKETDE